MRWRLTCVRHAPMARSVPGACYLAERLISPEVREEVDGGAITPSRCLRDVSLGHRITLIFHRWCATPARTLILARRKLPPLAPAAQSQVGRHIFPLRVRAPPGPGSGVQDGYEGSCFQLSHPPLPASQVGRRPTIRLRSETPPKGHIGGAGGGARGAEGGSWRREKRHPSPLYILGACAQFSP